LQNSCKQAYFYSIVFPAVSGDLLGLLHGCCTYGALDHGTADSPSDLCRRWSSFGERRQATGGVSGRLTFQVHPTCAPEWIHGDPLRQTSRLCIFAQYTQIRWWAKRKKLH
jgi:hypothetical protein